MSQEWHARLNAEILVFIRRHSWLQVLLQSESERVQGVIAAALPGNESDNVSGGGRIAIHGCGRKSPASAQVARTCACSRSQKAVLTSCTTKDDPKAKVGGIANLKQVVGVLMISCFTALSPIWPRRGQRTRPRRSRSRRRRTEREH